MQIVCPHCDTQYDVRDDALGAAGRTVRCARCKETWLALPVAEPAVAGAEGQMPIGRESGDSDFPSPPPPDILAADPVHVDSPPLAAEIPGQMPAATAIDPVPQPIEPIRAPLRRQRKSRGKVRLGLPVIITGLCAICTAIVFWRADIVRLMPQTAPFFKTLGLGVNLRALDFAGIKTTSETVNGTTILVIEGEVRARKPVEIPRLRFGLNDATGKEIHAWNATIEQASLGAGERAPFVSRLAAPPADGREITVRFFNRRDIVSGGKSMPRILIADDEEAMRGLVARALMLDGHETVTAEDGAEALDILARDKARSIFCSPTSRCRSWTEKKTRAA